MIRVERLLKRFAVRRRWVDLLRPLRPAAFTTAVDRVSLEVGSGEIVGLLGPNGAGKTTLLKILATLITPDGGRAEVGGFDVVVDAARVRRLLAPVAADERSLDWRLSARENLRFHAALHGLWGKALRRRIDDLLGAVGLAATGQQLVAAFSSGMRQRLLIARALLSGPRVLLLDEPTRSLDPVAARDFRAFLRREIGEKQGCTVLLATHDPDEAGDLCDRIAILDRGRLLALGSPSELNREFGEERYRIWTRTPSHSLFATLAAADSRRRLRPLEAADSWTVVEVELPAGGDDAAAVLGRLVNGGAQVGRFEKVQPTLADLIERVMDRRRVGADA